MVQKERKHSASPLLLAGSLFFFVALSLALPPIATATVSAYMDVQGEIHYLRAKTGSTNDFAKRDKATSNPKVVINRPGERATGDSIPQTINVAIQAAAIEHRVDPLLIKAVIKAESNFDPYAVSTKGAQGLMQLMPATAKDLQVADPFDPRENIAGGTKYLRYLLDSYDGDVALTLAAYNAGPGNVKDTIPNIRETRIYIAKVLDNYQSFQRRR